MNKDEIKFVVNELIENDREKGVFGLADSFKKLLAIYDDRIDKLDEIWLIEFALGIIQRMTKKIKKYWQRVDIPKDVLEKFIKWGFNLSEIGTFYNVSRQTMSKRVVEYDLDYLFKEGYDKRIDKKRLEKFVEEGVSPGFLSEYFNVPNSLVNRLMKKWGLESGPPISKEELEGLLSEKTFTEIVKLKKGKVSFRSLNYWTKKYGLWDKRINTRRKYNITKDELDMLIGERGFSVRKIAEYYNCSVANIYVKMKEWGLKINKY